MQLPQTAVDQHQARERLVLVAQALVAARHHFAHRRKIVHARHRSHNELAIFALVHLAVFPHHHGRNGLSALYVRNVEALNSFRTVRQAERILQRFLHGLGLRLHHAETLVK